MRAAKRIINSLKISALFIGTIIGAGFATGRELALYFGNANVATLVLSALLMGGFCFLFLLAGQKGISYSPKVAKAVKVVLAVAAFFLYTAMLAAAEELINAYFEIPLAGLVLGLISLVFASTLERLKILNFVLIPFLVAVVILIAKNADKSSLGVFFNPINALAYCAMNMLFAAELVKSAGKDMQVKDMVISSVVVTFVMFVLMYLMLQTIVRYKGFSMPFVHVAIKSGYNTVGIIAILIAIITTMASCNKIIADYINDFVHNAPISYFIVLAMGMAVSIFGFATLVNYTYPVISILGVVICLLTLYKMFSIRKKITLSTKSITMRSKQ